MPASLVDKLKGRFDNGIPVADVPERLRVVFSIEDNLRAVLNTARGSCPASPKLGLPLLPDTFARVPTDVASYEQTLREAVLYGEPRVATVHFAGWHLEGKAAHLSCLLLCRLRSTGDVCRFKVTLRGVGGNLVDLWKAEP